jgi:hypothetical protein
MMLSDYFLHTTSGQIHPSEVLMNKIRGRKITILGDTSNPWPMVGIAR